MLEVIGFGGIAALIFLGCVLMIICTRTLAIGQDLIRDELNEANKIAHDRFMLLDSIANGGAGSMTEPD